MSSTSEQSTATTGDSDRGPRPRGQSVTRRAAGGPAGARARRLRADADHRRARWAEHERTAREGELPARRTGRPAVLRQRSQRPALHPRQAEEDVHHLSRPQRRGRTAGPVPEVHLRAQFRHRPHQLRVRSRLPAQRRVLHAAHGGRDPDRRRRTAQRRNRRPRPVGVHDDAGDPGARRDREDRARGHPDRMEGSQPRRREVRGHGP